MNFSALVSNLTGVVHLASAVLAMATGLWVLIRPKGTRAHRRTGYVYASSMAVLNLTAFLIYRLYGGFGIFHVFALLSIATLAAGMYPVLARKRPGYLLQHFNYMYWSVIGLYCAFMAETFTRLPSVVLDEAGRPVTIFYAFTGVGIGVVMLAGVLAYRRLRPVWAAQFGEAGAY